MKTIKNFFEIRDKEDFNDFAIKTFIFQYRNNLVYKKYCDLIGYNLDSVKALKIFLIYQ